jgi:transposase
MKQIFSSEKYFFGIDVASKELVVSVYPAAQTKAFEDNRKSIKSWLKTVPSGSVIAVEATGSYDQNVLDLAHVAGMNCYLLNPKDVRHYAKSTGARSKTDAVDAIIVARYVAKEHMDLHLWQPAPAPCRKMDTLLNRRAKLVAVDAALAQSFAGTTFFRNDLSTLRQRIAELLGKIDRMIKQATATLPDGKQASERLQTIPGVGLLTSSYLLSLFIRVPFQTADAVVAFSGLDPRANDSGTKIGRRRLSKRGPSEMRRLLYNAAMSGVKTLAWKQHYWRLREQGKTSTAALVIVARKILRLAFSLYKNQTTFDPTRLASIAA